MKKLPCNILSVDGAALAFIAVINTKKKVKKGEPRVSIDGTSTKEEF